MRFFVTEYVRSKNPDESEITQEFPVDWVNRTEGATRSQAIKAVVMALADANQDDRWYETLRIEVTFK